jgi:hypothetical protein
LDKPKELGGSEMMIGTLKTTSEMVASKWADENLFFRHQKMSEDLAK